MLVKFKIWGNMRFLSHAETVRVFQRACIRAGIDLAYSKGFNPRPKLSLPLPRSVGVEADDDLLCLQIEEAPVLQKNRKTGTQDSASSFDGEQFKTRVSEQLPEGFELLSVSITESKISFQPCLATYVFVVQPEYVDDKLRTRIAHLMKSESLVLQRQTDAKGNIRNVDVREFLKSIELEDETGSMTVECRISSAGSVRVDEILELLELDTEKLAVPIRRTNVQWLQKF